MRSAISYAVARLRAFLADVAMDRDFNAELESHLELLTDEYVARGLTVDEARRRASIRLGSASSLKAQHRDVRGLPVVDGLVQDLRFAFRMIAKERWLSATIVLTLALGIGANTMGFAVVNGAFFRALPFPESADIYTLTWRSASGRRVDVSSTDLAEWRTASQTFDELAAFADISLSLSDDEKAAEQVGGTWMTANAFGVLRQQPFIGRDFAAGEDEPGASPVVILGFDLWRMRYGGDPNVVGRTVRVNRRPATIIGVMPEGMRFPDNTQLWMPSPGAGDADRRASRMWTIFGRVRPGIAQAQAQAEFTGIARRLSAAHPELNRDVVGINVETFAQAFVGGMGRTMFILIMAAVTFVLLIACANVANLLLARSASRAREIALRLALGATRRRVVRQLLTESLLLSFIGGGMGLFVADAGIALFERSNAHSGLPYWVVFEWDVVVFAYVAGICAATAILFGLAPAAHVSRANAHMVLKESGRSVLGSTRLRWFSNAMVSAEIALTIVLLGGAGLMLHSFMNLYAVDVGADINSLMAMRLQLPREMYPDAEARRAFFAEVEQRLGALPGVRSLAVTTGVPPADGGERLLEVDGAIGSGEVTPRFVSTVTISPAFFSVVNRPLIRGRAFDDGDGTPGSQTVIINERLAAQFFPGEDPIGRRLRFTQRQPVAGQPSDVWRTVVGLSAPIHHGSPQDGYVNAVVYIPYRQDAPAAASLLIRSPLPPSSLMDLVRREVRAVDRDQSVSAIQTVREMMAEDRGVYRVYGGLFAVLAAVSIVLSFVGVYAVISFSVAQRTQEFGVRMAVGAERRQMSWLVLKRGLSQLAIGLPVGVAGALALGVAIERMLIGLTPADPLTLALVTLVLTIVSLGACVIPAHRASRVDPMTALRAE